MFRLIFILLFSTSVQATDPTFTVGSNPIYNIQNTGTALNLGDDVVSSAQNLGFDFTYYGNTYSQARVAMNGFVTFNLNFNVYNSRNYMSETLPASGFDFTIMPLWSDFIDRNNNNGSPYVGTYGDAGSRYWVAGWYNVNEFYNNNLSSFEAILYESTNVIEFRYDKINVSNHDITIGLQGNNEAVTYLRYEDTNSTTFNRTEDWSLTTAPVIDESFSNLSSECLIDSDYSELCDVYDLSFDVEEEDDYYLQGSGVSDAMLLGYDDEEDFYGFNTEEVYTGTLVFSTVTDSRDSGGNYYDDVSSISYLDYDTRDVIEHEDDFNNFDIFDFGDSTLGGSEEGLLTFIEIDLDLDVLPPLDALPEIRVTEEEFIEFAQHMDEHFDFEDEMDREEWDEQFEDFEETIEEEIEQREEIEEIEEQYEEEMLQEEEEALDETIDEISPEEIEEDRPERSERRRQLVRNNINTTNRTTSNIVNSSVSSGQTSQNVNSSGNSSSAVVSSSGGGVSVSNSPSISAQISAAQVQTNTVLQSIEVIPMPSMDNTPSVVMAEVQVTTMENQIESVTSSIMTSSEADQIAEEVVASNIRAQQETSQAQQEESGEYDSQGQSNLIAFMNYVPNFNSYSAVTIPDQANWYQPTQIYADAVLRDNGNAYGELVNTSMETLYSVIQSQPVQLFIDRR